MARFPQFPSLDIPEESDVDSILNRPEPIFKNLKAKLEATPEVKNKYTLEDLSRPMGEREQDAWLATIGQLESRGGQDTAHTPQSTGLHAGTQAIGTWGLMPKTVKEQAAMFKNPQSAFRNEVGLDYTDPEVEALADMDTDEIFEKVKNNPKLEQRLVRYLQLTIGNRTNFNPDKMAYSWRFGSSLRDKDITPEMLDQSGYVKKFRETYQPKSQVTQAQAPVQLKTVP